MRADTDKDKRFFFLFLGISFVLIFVCNLLTPFISDDYSYGAQVMAAGSPFELFGQEFRQYMTWNGRSIVHLLLRFSLYFPNILFKLVNSACFILLSLLIYINAVCDRKYDIRLIAGITVMLWAGCADLAGTVLWQTGACNYLWGTVIIMGYLTLFRRIATDCVKTDTDGAGKSNVLQIVGMFLFGLLAGWCNENTSGGAVLLSGGILLTGRSRKRSLYAGIIGQLTGLILMVGSPGGRMRAALTDPENFEGILKYAARFQKLILTTGRLYLPWILLFLFLAVLVYHQTEGGSKEKRGRLSEAVYIFAVFVITSFALVMAPPPQDRAHFGAGIFLFTAIAQLYCRVEEKEPLTRTLKSWAVLAGAVWLFFFCAENVTDLGRIYRESRERVLTVENETAAGNNGIVTVYKLRPQFDTPLSAIYDAELSEDPEYWTNRQMAEYYGVDGIKAIPREDAENVQE